MLHIKFEDRSVELELNGNNHSDEDIREIVARHFDVGLEQVQDYEIDRYGKDIVFRPEERA
jgi:hypothetical protein